MDICEMMFGWEMPSSPAVLFGNLVNKGAVI
jgi:hypothetical protein